jgi:hypothetical protein
MGIIDFLSMWEFLCLKVEDGGNASFAVYVQIAGFLPV